MLAYMKKHRHNLIVGLLVFFIISNLGFTFAFWASSISGSSTITSVNINIGTFVPTGFTGVSQNGSLDNAEWISFDQIQPNGNYVQMTDINFNGATKTPKAQFNGVYNGNGFKISNFTISAASANVGLFSINNGDISRIHIENGNISISNYANNMNVGLIAGQNIGSGKISYVSASGTINVGLKDTGSGTGDRTLTLNAGGLSGANSGTITKVYTNVGITTSVETKTNTGGFFGSTGYNATSNNSVGGITGSHSSAVSILDSYATGNISTSTTATAPDGWIIRVDGVSNLYMGGLVGSSSIPNPTTNSFATNTLTHTISGDTQNRFIGPIVGSNVTVINSYYVNQPSNYLNLNGTQTTVVNLKTPTYITSTVLFTPSDWTLISNQYPKHSHKRD